MFRNLIKTTPKKIVNYQVANYFVKTEVMTFTPRAISQLKKLVNDPTKTAIQLNVKTKGCSGHSYQLQLVDKENTNIHIGEVINIDNLMISINPKSIMHIIGTKMDYVEDELVSEFIFNNPNVVEKCGCGESVKFK
jgi:iron-sulfur cluster assembly protein